MKKNASEALTLIARNRRAHDRIASKYDQKHTEIYNSIEQARLEQVLHEVVAKMGTPEPHILDVGAGTGNISMKLLQLNSRVTALDVSAGSLEVLRSKAEPDARLETVRLEGQKFRFSGISHGGQPIVI